MRTRGCLVLALAVAAGSFTPAMAATKPKPKPIQIAYTATALPDPTTTTPGSVCGSSTTGKGRHQHAFKVPAAGVLTVSLDNTMDWSLSITDAQGDVLEISDGDAPAFDAKESVTVPFKRAEKVTINACNFAGEPEVQVTGTFTYK